MGEGRGMEENEENGKWQIKREGTGEKEMQCKRGIEWQEWMWKVGN